MLPLRVGDGGEVPVVMCVGVFGHSQRYGFTRLPSRAGNRDNLAGQVVILVRLDRRVSVELPGGRSAARYESQVVRSECARYRAGACGCRLIRYRRKTVAPVGVQLRVRERRARADVPPVISTWLLLGRSTATCPLRATCMAPVPKNDVVAGSIDLCRGKIVCPVGSAGNEHVAIQQGRGCGIDPRAWTSRRRRR